MANNENMINETIEVMNDNIVVDEASGMGAGVAMLIGAGLAVAVGAAVGLGKKLAANWKAKKELNKPDKEIIVEAEDLVDVATK
jgi:hypothetical protein